MKATDTALAALPHGPEFRFVDRLIRLDPGRSGIGEYRLPPEAPFLRGHFPGAPLMPGVLLVEAIAQLAGVIAQSDPGHLPLSGLKLTALRGVKILGSAQPGDVITLTVEVLGRLGGLIQARGEAMVHGSVVTRAEVTLSGEPAPGTSKPAGKPQAGGPQ